MTTATLPTVTLAQSVAALRTLVTFLDQNMATIEADAAGAQELAAMFIGVPQAALIRQAVADLPTIIKDAQIALPYIDDALTLFAAAPAGDPGNPGPDQQRFSKGR